MRNADRSQRTRYVIAALLAAEAAATAFAPDPWIMTPAHALFFGAVPRWAWALAQAGAAAGLVWTAHRRRHEVTGAYVAAACCATWAGVALYPALIGQPWNVVSLLVWACVTTGVLLATRR